MSTQEIAASVAELQELRRMQEELNAEIDALQDRIKAHMTASARRRSRRARGGSATSRSHRTASTLPRCARRCPRSPHGSPERPR